MFEDSIRSELHRPATSADSGEGDIIRFIASPSHGSSPDRGCNWCFWRNQRGVLTFEGFRILMNVIRT